MQTAKLARLALKVIALQMFARFLSRRMTTWTHILVPSSLDISAQFASELSLSNYLIDADFNRHSVERRVLQLDIVSLRVVCLRFTLILQGKCSALLLTTIADRNISEIQTTSAFMKHGARHYKFLQIHERVQSLMEVSSGMFCINTGVIYLRVSLLIAQFSQGSLDGVVVHQPRAPTFTTSGLLDYIVELVVCEDKVSVCC